MARIRPFRALRYNTKNPLGIAMVTAPPFDCISPELRDDLYRLHPHSVVRLILGRDEPGDNDSVNKYTRAADLMAKWQRTGILKRDPEPALYFYQQEFEAEGEPYLREGVLARVGIEEFGTGKVFPHEETMDGVRADRMRLIRATRANLSPIFAVYPDPKNVVPELFHEVIHCQPLVQTVDADGVVHRLFSSSDTGLAEHVAAAMADKPIFIADGHHRYETAQAYRRTLIEKGEQVMVGVNAYTETEPSPLATTGTEGILTVPESVEIEQVASLQSWRQQRDDEAVQQALIDLKSAAAEGRNIMPPSIAAAKAGVTTGEWGQVLREVFGEYRAPTGIHAEHPIDTARLEDIRRKVEEVSGRLGRSLTFVVGKPGLDGHSNGAEQIAVRASDVGMEVVYDGIRLTPAEIVEQAKQARAHVVGLSILSGSHVALVREVVQRLREAGLGDVPVVVGGIIPAEDVNVLKQCGASAVYTPKDFQLNDIMAGIVGLVEAKAADLVKQGVPVPPARAREKVPL